MASVRITEFRLDSLNIDTEDVLKDVGEELRSIVINNFVNSVDPYGNAWKELSPQTIRRKGSSKPLIDTGTLMNSIDYNVSGRILKLFTGAEAPYGVYHQEGTGRIPRRSFFPDPDDLPDDWLKVIEDSIHNAISRS